MHPNLKRLNLISKKLKNERFPNLRTIQLFVGDNNKVIEAKIGIKKL